MKNSIPYLFFLSITLFFSCSDPDEDVSPIQGSWNLVAWDIKTENPPSDWSPKGEDCRLDDIEEYQPNGTWVKYDGSHQCAGGNGIGIYRGTWRLTANNSKVIYTYAEAQGEYESTVETLTATTMVLTFASGTVDGTQNRVTYTKN